MNCNYGPPLISNHQFLKKPGTKPVIRFDSGCLRISPARLRLAGGNSHTRPHKTNNLYIVVFKSFIKIAFYLNFNLTPYFIINYTILEILTKREAFP